MPKVRTTIQPHVELDVSDAEYLDLKRQGLLARRAPSTPSAQPSESSPSAAAPAKSLTGKSSKES